METKENASVTIAGKVMDAARTDKLTVTPHVLVSQATTLSTVTAQLPATASSVTSTPTETALDSASASQAGKTMTVASGPDNATHAATDAMDQPTPTVMELKNNV